MKVDLIGNRLAFSDNQGPKNSFIIRKLSNFEQLLTKYIVLDSGGTYKPSIESTEDSNQEVSDSYVLEVLSSNYNPSKITTENSDSDDTHYTTLTINYNSSNGLSHVIAPLVRMPVEISDTTRQATDQEIKEAWSAMVEEWLSKAPKTDNAAYEFLTLIKSNINEYLYVVEENTEFDSENGTYSDVYLVPPVSFYEDVLTNQSKLEELKENGFGFVDLIDYDVPEENKLEIDVTKANLDSLTPGALLLIDKEGNELVFENKAELEVTASAPVMP